MQTWMTDMLNTIKYAFFMNVLLRRNDCDLDASIFEILYGDVALHVHL